MDDAKTKSDAIHPAFLLIFCALLVQPRSLCPDYKSHPDTQQLPGPQEPCAAPAPGMGRAAGAEHQDLTVGFHASLRGAWICSPPSQPGFAPLVEAAEVHRRLVRRKSFVSLKLRKQLWKQSPQNNPKQGWVDGAYKFLMLLSSECDFSALK